MPKKNHVQLRSEKEIKFCRRLFTSSIKRYIWHFHAVVVQNRQRNVQKSVLHMQSCCLLIKPIALLDVLVLPKRRRILKSLLFLKGVVF